MGGTTPHLLDQEGARSPLLHLGRQNGTEIVVFDEPEAALPLSGFKAAVLGWFRQNK